MRRLRIGVSTHLFPSEKTLLSGPWLAEQVDALTRSVDVVVLAALRDVEKADVIRPSGVRVAYRPTRVTRGDGRLALLMSAVRYLWTARRFYSAIAPDIDVLHAHFGFPDAVVVSRVARALNIPWVATLHGDDAFFLLGRKGLLGRIMRTSLARAAAVICVSEAMATAVRPYLPASTPLHVIPNGFDSTLFKLSHEPREGLLFAGTLTKTKNVDLLIRAYASLKFEESLRIAGAGPLRDELSILAHELGIDDRVEFLGTLSREETAREMRSARALVIPSSSEGFGMVAAEALGCGTPVVASSVGGLPDIVASPESGVLVEPNSIGALAQGIEHVLARTWDPEAVAAGSGARPWSERAEEVSSVYLAVTTIPRIGYLSLHATAEGQEGWADVDEIVAGLRRRAWRVDFLQPSYVGSAPPGGLRRLVESFRLQLLMVHRLHNLDAVYIRSHNLAFPLALYARLRGVPVIQECNGPYEDLFTAWPRTRCIKRPLVWAMNRQYCWANHVITVTEELASWIRAETGHNRVTVVPNGANTDLFVPAKSMGNPNEKFVIFFGSLAPWQGISTMIEATASHSWPEDVTLVIAGDGILRQTVEQATENGRIRYVGSLSQQELAPLVAGAIASLIIKDDPAHIESGLSPLKLFESMAAGVPVIVSDFPSLRAVVDHWGCGVVTPPGGAEQLATAVATLADDPEGRLIMGNNGRQHALEEFSWDTAVERTATVILQSAQPRRR